MNKVDGKCPVCKCRVTSLDNAIIHYKHHSAGYTDLPKRAYQPFGKVYGRKEI